MDTKNYGWLLVLISLTHVCFFDILGGKIRRPTFGLRQAPKKFLKSFNPENLSPIVISPKGLRSTGGNQGWLMGANIIMKRTEMNGLGYTTTRSQKILTFSQQPSRVKMNEKITRQSRGT